MIAQKKTDLEAAKAIQEAAISSVSDQPFSLLTKAVSKRESRTKTNPGEKKHMVH
jgi:hypothetical protein